MKKSFIYLKSVVVVAMVVFVLVSCKKEEVKSFSLNEIESHQKESVFSIENNSSLRQVDPSLVIGSIAEEYGYYFDFDNKIYGNPVNSSVNIWTVPSFYNEYLFMTIVLDGGGRVVGLYKISFGAGPYDKSNKVPDYRIYPYSVYDMEGDATLFSGKIWISASNGTNYFEVNNLNDGYLSNYYHYVYFDNIHIGRVVLEPFSSDLLISSIESPLFLTFSAASTFYINYCGALAS